MSDAGDIFYLYWDTDIPVREIVEAYGLERQIDVPRIAGPATFEELKCVHCGDLIEIFSRTELKMRLGETRFGGDLVAQRFPRHCQPCGTERKKAFDEARDRAYRAREQQVEVRKAQLHSMPYAEYLQTPEWQATRGAALRRARYSCQTCARPGPLNVHHRTYIRRGDERPSDLIVLCADCHKLFHEKSTLADKGRAKA